MGNRRAVLKVSLRLCFIKLPDTPDTRIFRDVLLFVEPDDKSFQNLSDIVERKLSFMEIPPAEFTVFFTEPTTGDRVVVDVVYFEALVSEWFTQVKGGRNSGSNAVKGRRDGKDSRARSAVAQHRQTVVRTRSFSEEAQSPFPMGAAAPAPPPSSSVSDHSSSESGSSSRGSGSRGRPTEVGVTFDVEVNRLRSFTAAVAALGQGSSSHPSTSSAARTLEWQQQQQQLESGVTVAQAVAVRRCLPLTAANLSALMQQTSSPQPPPTLPPAVSPPAAPAGAASVPTEDVLMRVGDLVCPPCPPNFYLRCVALDIRLKMPKPGLSIGEIDLCDAADPRQVITGVTFDATVQREMKQSLRCDGRQVLELRRVYVRRKNELDARYATNAHPLLLRIDRGSRLSVVQVLTIPITTRAPVVTADASPSAANAANPLSEGGTPAVVVVPLRDASGGGALRHGGGVMELGELARLRAVTGAAVSSSSSSSTGPRRTTFAIGAGNTSASSSSFYATTTGVTSVSGVVPSAYGSHLRQHQQLLLARAMQQQQQQHQHQQQQLYEPGVIPVTLHDVRAREALVEQHANKETWRKERIRRKLEVSQACLLCGLDLSPGHEAECLAQVRHLLEANHRNKGNCIPTMEQLHDALCDRRPVLLARQRAQVQRPTRLCSQQTFVSMQSKTNHIVHCRCAHLCSEYQSGGSLEDLVWCDLPTQVCALCGLPGAFVACYHPDCTEHYHAVCALFSGGYVNFGKRDPFLPCPACPRHTQVVLTHGKRGKAGSASALSPGSRTRRGAMGAGGLQGDAAGRAEDEDGSAVLHVDNSCWTDEDIAFDSRVVAEGDLRDPDENDGE